MFERYYGNLENPLPSFPVPVVPPSDDPDAGDQVGVCFSAAWLPYILAALQQLAQWQSWQGDEAARLTAVQRGVLLIDMFAQAGECIMQGITDIRFNGCRLEYSRDAGENWIDGGSFPGITNMQVNGRDFTYSRDCGDTWIDAGELACCVEPIDSEIRCRVAFGFAQSFIDRAEFIINDALQTWHSWDLLDSSTFDYLVTDWNLTPDNFNDFRGIFISIAQTWDTFGGAFADVGEFLQYMLDLFTAHEDAIRCATWALVDPAGNFDDGTLFGLRQALKAFGDIEGDAEQYIWLEISELIHYTYAPEWYIFAQQARVSDESYDCSTCAEPVTETLEIDLTGDDGGGFSAANCDGHARTVWTSGDGWISQKCDPCQTEQAYVRFLLSSTQQYDITGVMVVFEQVNKPATFPDCGGDPTVSDITYHAEIDHTPDATSRASGYPTLNAPDGTYTWNMPFDGSFYANQVKVQLLHNYNPASDWHMKLKTLRVTYTNAIPL